MSMTVPTLSSVLNLKISPLYSLGTRVPGLTVPFPSSLTNIQSFKPIQTRNFHGFSGKIPELLFRRNLWVCVAAKNDDDAVSVNEAEKEARGESTLPERFRYLTKEAPDPPLRWPFFVAVAFLLYAWRAVLFELYNWKKAAFAVVRFVGYILKLVLALIFHFFGDPITSLIRCIETTLYTIRSFYSGIVAYAPVPELTTIIILSSAVLAIAESTVPESVNSQQYILTISGLIGYAAVRGYISEPFFWTLLVGLYGFSRFIKKRDDVSSALPAAAVLAAVGEPWVRVLAMASYLALAIFHHSKTFQRGEEEVAVTTRKLPLPLLGVALAIGIRIAAKWAGYRHLTWMIV
ncbi:embryo defective [Parasponia andersonii]|uniref:Embryo defective n=1 Tax=Parasponia andersonii TaxID=3476 RepID=A0A2P5E4T5_PARAD|nr:embryo defective [Parasponia andersonii]